MTEFAETYDTSKLKYLSMELYKYNSYLYLIYEHFQFFYTTTLFIFLFYLKKKKRNSIQKLFSFFLNFEVFMTCQTILHSLS